MSGRPSIFWQQHDDEVVPLAHRLWATGNFASMADVFAEAARQLGSTTEAFRLRYQGWMREAKQRTPLHPRQQGAVPTMAAPAPASPPHTIPGQPKDIRDLLDLPARPFAVPVPRVAARAAGKYVHTFCYGDSHFPNQDEGALRVIRGLIADIAPERIVHMGDGPDCYTISRFSKDPNRLHNLQGEIDLWRAHLHQISQLAPRAEKHWLEGNHEQRLQRLIWDLPGGSAELARLTAFREAMTWPVLVGTADIGWTFHPTQGQSKMVLLPKLILKHGQLVRKWSGWSAKGEWERYGRGGLSGHTHRLGKFYHRDHNGSHVWIETGCTCSLTPGYVEDPDWQQGCVLVTHKADGSWFSIEDIFIQDGQALWRDRFYRGAA